MAPRVVKEMTDNARRPGQQPRFPVRGDAGGRAGKARSAEGINSSLPVRVSGGPDLFISSKGQRKNGQIYQLLFGRGLSSKYITLKKRDPSVTSPIVIDNRNLPRFERLWDDTKSPRCCDVRDLSHVLSEQASWRLGMCTDKMRSLS